MYSLEVIVAQNEQLTNEYSQAKRKLKKRAKTITTQLLKKKYSGSSEEISVERLVLEVLNKLEDGGLIEIVS